MQGNWKSFETAGRNLYRVIATVANNVAMPKNHNYLGSAISILVIHPKNESRDSNRYLHMVRATPFTTAKQLTQLRWSVCEQIKYMMLQRILFSLKKETDPSYNLYKLQMLC